MYWFRRGAEAGDMFAQDNLGACYRDGVGVEANYKLAREWFQKVKFDAHRIPNSLDIIQLIN